MSSLTIKKKKSMAVHFKPLPVMMWQYLNPIVTSGRYSKTWTVTEHRYHYQSITEKRTGRHLSGWLLKLLILPIVWVCASEKRTWKKQHSLFHQGISQFHRGILHTVYPDISWVHPALQKVFYHELSSPKNASKKRGRLVLFFFFFPLQLLPLAVANDIKVSKDDNMLEKKVQGIICITQKTRRLGEKIAVGKRRNFEKLRDVQKKSLVGVY